MSTATRKGIILAGGTGTRLYLSVEKVTMTCVERF